MWCPEIQCHGRFQMAHLEPHALPVGLCRARGRAGQPCGWPWGQAKPWDGCRERAGSNRGAGQTARWGSPSPDCQGPPAGSCSGLGAAPGSRGPCLPGQQRRGLQARPPTGSQYEVSGSLFPTAAVPWLAAPPVFTGVPELLNSGFCNPISPKTCPFQFLEAKTGTEFADIRRKS